MKKKHKGYELNFGCCYRRKNQTKKNLVNKKYNFINENEEMKIIITIRLLDPRERKKNETHFNTKYYRMHSFNDGAQKGNQPANQPTSKQVCYDELNKCEYIDNEKKKK